MQFMDSHIHLQDFKSVYTTEFMAHTRLTGIDKFISVSALETDWEKVLELSGCFPETVIPALGLHPWHVAEAAAGWEERLEQLLSEHTNALIGECGLDSAKGRDVSLQKPAFEKQLELARKYQRPLLVHSVRATGETLALLKNAGVVFVWHSFGGSPETAAQIFRLGGFIGINPGFFKTRHWQSVLSSAPVEQLLLESDAPYQYPPESLPDICHCLNEFYKKDISQVLYQNSLRFINGKK